MDLVTRSPEETLQLGRALGRILRPGDVLALDGDLGAGKTLLTKGIASAWGIDPGTVTSPTFALINEYQGKIPIYHFDVYRLERLSEMEDLGYEEYLYGEGITIIEWAEKVEPLLPPGHIKIEISRGVSDNERRIRVEGTGGPEAKREFDRRLSLLEDLQ